MTTVRPRLAVLLIVAVASVLGSASLAPAHQIHIAPGSYSYPYSINAHPPVTGSVVIDLRTGTHEIETGGYINVRGVASSRFRFTVTSSGAVTNVVNAVTGQPSGAATGQGSRLVFKQASITIEPGRFRDAYYLQYADMPLKGEQTVVLVPDVAYLFELAPAATTQKGDPSGFYFVLDVAGRISKVLTPSGIPSACAVGAGQRLRLNR